MTATMDKPQKSAVPHTEDGAIELTVEQMVRYRVYDPFKILSTGGAEVNRKTLAKLVTAGTRTLASRSTPQEFVDKKDMIGKKVQGCLNRHPHETVGPSLSKIQSLAIGLGAALLLALVLQLIPMPHPYFRFAPIAIGIGWFMASLKNIPIAHAGVLILFGGRIQKILTEGDHWVPWPLQIAKVPMMPQTIEHTINVIAGNANIPGRDPLETGDDELGHDFGDESGIEIIEVINGEIMPANKELLRMMEKIDLEKLEGEAEDIELKKATRRAMLLRKALKIDGTVAMNMVMTLMKKQTREETVISGGSSSDRTTARNIATAKNFARNKGK